MASGNRRLTRVQVCFLEPFFVWDLSGVNLRNKKQRASGDKPDHGSPPVVYAASIDIGSDRLLIFNSKKYEIGIRN
jgi:hypothetical protein